MTVLAVAMGVVSVVSCEEPAPEVCEVCGKEPCVCDEPDPNPGEVCEVCGEDPCVCEKPNPNPDPNPSGLHKVDFPFNEEFPVECGNLVAEGTDVGVTIEVKAVEDMNFVFELRPGAMVQSFKLDVYPVAQLYNNLLNMKNSGTLVTGDAVEVNNRIRDLLFIDGSGGYAFSVNDFSNPEDFLQIEYDWMNTQYAAASAVAIPDCGYVIAVVASADADISSANQEELTLCYVHTSSQPVVGDPQCEIEVRTGYRAFSVQHHPNADAAGIYYFGGASDEIDDYIDTFGDTMFRDFMRTLYTSPIASDNVDGLLYSFDYGQNASSEIQSTTCAVAVDANLTPQEGYARRDFTLDEMPPEDEQDLTEPKVTVLQDRIAAAYVEVEAIIPKTCNAIFYGFYTEEEKKALEEGSSLDKKKEAIRLVQEGWAEKNSNFAWDKTLPDDEKATGSSQKVILEGWGENCFVPGATLYVGYTARNGYGTPTPLAFSEPITLDERNLTTPDNCNVKDLQLWIDDVTRTSFDANWSYDPETVSLVYMQYMTPENKPADLTVESSWQEWVNFIFTPDTDEYMINSNMNMIRYIESGRDHYGYAGMNSSTEHTVFLCAEDFDGNVSVMKFATATTKDVVVGPNPKAEIKLEQTVYGNEIVFNMIQDAEKMLYCKCEKVADLNIPGATQSDFNNMAESDISYETWRDYIYEWALEVGMETNSESTSLSLETDKTTLAACIAVGRDENGEPVYSLATLICKDGKAQTLEEMFGITE